MRWIPDKEWSWTQGHGNRRTVNQGLGPPVVIIGQHSQMVWWVSIPRLLATRRLHRCTDSSTFWSSGLFTAKCLDTQCIIYAYSMRAFYVLGIASSIVEHIIPRNYSCGTEPITERHLCHKRSQLQSAFSAGFRIDRKKTVTDDHL